MEPFDSEQVAEWIHSARSGDDQALSELIGAAMEYLFPATLGMLRDRRRQGTYLTDTMSSGGPDLIERMKDDAWEVTHAACCRMALKLHTFRGRDLLGREVKFSTWLYAIARNEVRNLLRSRYREAKRRWRNLPPAGAGEQEAPTDFFALRDTASEAPGPEQIAEEMDERRIILEALEEAPLTPEQREAVLLYYGHGLRQERIADLTGVQVGTVKKRIFDGLRKLRAYVKERSGEPAKREGRA